MITNKKRNLRATALLVLGSFIAAHLCFHLLPHLFDTWNLKAVDRLFLFRSSSESFRPPYDETIVHVDLTDTTMVRLNNFYLDRSHYAGVIRNLTAMNTSAILCDTIFAAKKGDEKDDALIEASARAGNVYFGLAFELASNEDSRQQYAKDSKRELYLRRNKWQVTVKGDPRHFYTGTKPVATFPVLASASRGLGYLSVKFDRDGVFRRLPLLVRYDGAYYPSFSFMAICDYLGVPPEKITIRPGRSITLKDALRPGEKEPHDIIIPIDRFGHMLINFIGPWERMKHYNFADILLASKDPDDMDLWNDELAGKIAVVAEVSTGSSDVGPVPTDTNLPLAGLHANAMHTILTESFIRELSDYEMLSVELLLLTGLFIISLGFSSPYFALGTFAMSLFYVCVASTAFLYGNLIFHFVRPLLMITFATLFIVIYRYINEERERAFIRATFGRYLSKEVVEELLDSPDGLKLSGEMREVTFLVSDLRGFTALSSSLSPAEVIKVINRYLECMVDIIGNYRGTVNEIEGDGILTFFGAPLAGSDDAERAVACAIAMQRKMEEFNKEQQRLNIPELMMGIGIDTGEVVVGNIGSEKRTKYAAMGSPVNTAYRIESSTVGGQVLISASTFEKVRSILKVDRILKVPFKGLAKPVTLYEVKGIDGNYPLSMPKKKSDAFIKLETPLTVSCFPLEGKTVAEKSIQGHITSLGKSSAEVLLSEQVDVYSNLRILLDLQKAPGANEIYAKVVSLDKSDSFASRHMARLEFTYLSEDVKVFLEERRSGK